MWTCSRSWCCIFVSFEEWFEYWDWIWFEKTCKKSEHFCLILIMAIYYLLLLEFYYISRFYMHVQIEYKIKYKWCLQLLIRKFLIIPSHQHLLIFLIHFYVFGEKILVLATFFLLKVSNSMLHNLSFSKDSCF